MSDISIGLNLEFVRSADNSFRAGRRSAPPWSATSPLFRSVSRKRPPG